MIVTFLSDVEILEIVRTRNPPMRVKFFSFTLVAKQIMMMLLLFARGENKNLRRRNFQYARSSVFEESGKS